MRVSKLCSTLPVAVVSLFLAVSCTDDPVGGVLGSGRTVTVTAAGTGDFASVQQAIDESPAGTRIEISGGAIDGQVIVGKRITLAGIGTGVTLRMQGAPSPVPDESASGASSSAVLVIRNTSDVVIENLSLSGPQDGLQIRNSTRITAIGIDASNNGDDGVDVRESSNVSISGVFSGNGDVGVQVRDGSADVLIDNSTADSNIDRGVRIRESSDVLLQMSSIAGNGDDGVLVRDASGVVVQDNTITGNAGYGLRIRNSPDTVDQGNSLSGNTQGDVRLD